jgi:pimeloyl-ACP methyl ester carboxylesterase
MKTTSLNVFVKKLLMSTALIFTFLFSTTTSAQRIPAGVKNIVLVHGAFADGSGWKGVYEILSKKGYHVTIVQNPLSSLEDDVKATNVVLDNQDGPTVLVGHSWGGTVITEAGNHPNVVALVYVAAFQPDTNESALQCLQSAPILPENGVLAPDAKGIVYHDKAKFYAGFCADLSQVDADFMYASQGAFYAKGFVTPVTKAAWKDKPAYAVIPTDDKCINPVMQHAMSKRSNAKVTEIKASHVAFISQPKAVANVIITAATSIK